MADVNSVSIGSKRNNGLYRPANSVRALSVRNRPMASDREAARRARRPKHISSSG